MRSENGIPRPFQPSNLAQELRDLRREVAELRARRNFVSVERIVEGGTINENVGKQLTDTVQEQIVIERQNLAEAALTDVVVTGTISTKGKTAENPPRDISVSMTTVARNVLGQVSANPGIFFEVEGADPTLAPGVYSVDGESLCVGSSGSTSTSLLILGPTTRLASDSIALGGVLSTLIDVNTPGRTVGVGDSNATVNLNGSVKVNGTPVMRTVIAGLPAGAQPVELIGTGSARTSAAGVFTITFPPGTFGTACMSIDANPTSGTAGIPVVNGGRLFSGSAEMVIPSAPNTTITYSYRAVGY